jgi:multicomponent Na+:H+ antiporter subunit D
MAILVGNVQWVVWIILLPLAAAMLCFLAPRRAGWLGIIATIGVLVSVGGLCAQVVAHGALRYSVGGWGAPLGIDLHADGLSALMLAMTAVVGTGVGVYSLGYFGREQANPAGFWPLWLFLWTALNALFLSADIFNLYVTLELLGLAAAALVGLAGNVDALTGGIRYLLVGLLGSLAYLLGVALLYHAYGNVDILGLGVLVKSSPASWGALGLMTAALLLKSALFPLHFWLPPAHASAPAPVSALLSALVVKASFYLLLRLWLDVFPGLGIGSALGTGLGLLGAAAIIWGSLQALRQARLKLMVAYSTVAQVGYLFLPFSLSTTPVGLAAWSAGVYFMFSHALAKAAMFLAAGNVLKSGGHDRITDLGPVAQRMPITLAAFGLAGISIMGLPPSGGFVAKWLLLKAALDAGQWWWAVVMIVGGVLAAAYVFRVVGHAFVETAEPHQGIAVHPLMEWVALALALGAVTLGLIAPGPLALLQIGDPLATPTTGSGM